MKLVSLHPYGIHANIDEHFGIAAAEMVRGGCIVFVHNSGGQVEIVGGDERLVYHTKEEAAEKIINVMSNSNEQHPIRGYLHSRQGLFSAEIFMCRIQEIVRELCYKIRFEQENRQMKM